MHFFPTTRVFVEIGPFTIYWYAVLIIIGALIAYNISKYNIKKMGYDKEICEDLFMGALFFGILGARLWFCTFYNFNYYISNPIEILKIYDGGLAIQGGVIAGAIFGYIYAKRKNLNFFRFADAIVPNILIAQAIGRWGNFMNQEAYGGIVSESFYNHFPSFIKNMMFIKGEYRMPTFLYESVGDLIVFFIIIFIIKKFVKLKRGDLMYLYMIGYSIVRIYVEGLRTDSLMLGPIRMAQLTSLIFIILGVLGLCGVYRKIFKSKKPVILFDFDGTLVDTEPAISEAYRQLFVKYGDVNNFTDEVRYEILGPSIRTIFPKYFPNEDLDKLINEFRETQKSLFSTHIKPFDNVVDTLNYLKENGYKMGIVSTKPKEMIELCIEACNLQGYFDVIIGEGEVKEGKPNKEGIINALKAINQGQDEVIYIGDSVTDIKAGHNAGVYTIAYVSLKQREEALKATKPNRVMYDYKELQEILKEDNHQWTYNMM